MLQKMGTEQMKQFLCAVIAVMMYAEKEKRVLQLWDSHPTTVDRELGVPGQL